MRELSEKQADFLRLATTALRQRASDPDYQCWRIDASDDEATSYCRDCLKPEIGPAVEDWGGGYGGVESDGVEFCECCGKLLEYTLTDYGVSNELSHFAESDLFDWNDADECYELVEVSNGICENPDQERVLINVLLKGKNFPKELKRIRPPKSHEAVQS